MNVFSNVFEFSIIIYNVKRARHNILNISLKFSYAITAYFVHIC